MAAAFGASPRHLNQAQRAEGLVHTCVGVAQPGPHRVNRPRVDNDGYPFPYAFITGDLIYAIDLIACSLNAVQMILKFASNSSQTYLPSCHHCPAPFS